VRIHISHFPSLSCCTHTLNQSANGVGQFPLKPVSEAEQRLDLYTISGKEKGGSRVPAVSRHTMPVSSCVNYPALTGSLIHFNMVRLKTLSV
jgi:hypothetical protein